MKEYMRMLGIIRLAGFYRDMAIIAIFLLPGLAGAATYYVDFAAGNDANDGSSKLTPFRTIPGTYRSDGSTYLRTSWGAISASSRIMDNTTFNIKCGTTHSIANGGFVWLTSASTGFYQNGYTNLVIRADPTWGTGATATLDGTGMTIGIALFLLQIDGATIRGLDIRNSPMDGIQAKEKAGTGAALSNLVFDGLTFFNNGTSFLSDLAGSGQGQLNIRKAVNITVTNCVLSGDNNFMNGILMGDGHKTVSGLVINCTATNHRGDPVDNDAGIGFKALNCSLTFKNCTSTGNLKGFDLGEDSGFDAGPGGTPANILYKVLNCTARSNVWGINFNGSGDAYPGTITWYAINNLMTDNADTGMNAYNAPHNLYVVHNVFENNSLNPNGAPLYNGSQFATTPMTPTDVAPIQVYLFNNIFRGQKAGGGNYNTAVILNRINGPANNYTFKSDYNSYQQSGANTVFCMWSGSYAPGSAVFEFGANGPGHASGNWYNQYANNTTPPALGTGHFHNDAHSKGTGATDPTLPQLDANFMLTIPYPGLNLSTQPWYIPEMRFDRSGRTRTSWDIGAYDYGAVETPVISVTPQALNFGYVAVGASVTNQLVVKNDGSGTLSGTASATAPFTIVGGGTYSLGTGQSQTVQVRYAPTVAGTTNAQSVTFTGGGGTFVAVSGTTVKPPNLPPSVSAISQTGADVDLVSPGLQIYPGSLIQYSGSATDPNGDPITWQWIYSVNGGPEVMVQQGTGSVTSASFNYSSNTVGNSYLWKLRVSDGVAISESSLALSVKPLPTVTGGLSFPVASGAITAPFVLANGYIYQPIETMDTISGGRAVYVFSITNSGNYVVQALVNVPAENANSFYLNVDGEPQDPTMIWDIPLTSGFEQRVVSWRGNGDAESNEFVPKIFQFTAGTHQLIIRGREANAQIQSLAIVAVSPLPPQNLRLVGQ